MKNEKTFLNFKIKKRENRNVLYIEDVELKGVEDYKIKINESLPCGTAEIELKMLVEFI